MVLPMRMLPSNRPTNNHRNESGGRYPEDFLVGDKDLDLFYIIKNSQIKPFCIVSHTLLRGYFQRSERL